MSTSATGASSSAIFSGTSRFSSDFQQVLTRAVNIASLPITQLTNQVTNLQGQATALSSLGSKFSALQSAIQGLQKATGVNSLTASVADNSIAQVSLSAGASPATYTLQVTALGSYTNTLSADGLLKVSDPSTQNIAASGSLTLTVNGTSTTLTPQSNTLNSLVNAINSQPGSNVQASIVNVGSSGTPDYRLSVQSSKLGPVSIQLDSGSSSLLNNLSTGSLASYEVDGLSTPITSDSRTITLAPGVSANLSAQSATGVATTISVSQQTLSISNALSTFVNAYNGATDELNNSHGTSGGALQGQSLIVNLGNTLQQLGTFTTGASGIGSLTDLGITYEKTGHLSFDPSVFSSATAGQITALANFLGGATTGGFLQTATNLLSAVEDPTTGFIQGASTAIQNEITSSQNLITKDQDRVDQLQKNLQLQLAKSDALVASLEQSYMVLNGLIQAQTINTQAMSNGL